MVWKKNTEWVSVLWVEMLIRQIRGKWPDWFKLPSLLITVMSGKASQYAQNIEPGGDWATRVENHIQHPLRSATNRNPRLLKAQTHLNCLLKNNKQITSIFYSYKLLICLNPKRFVGSLFHCFAIKENVYYVYLPLLDLIKVFMKKRK